VRAWLRNEAAIEVGGPQAIGGGESKAKGGGAESEALLIRELKKERNLD